jgi:hypothetical protein
MEINLSAKSLDTMFIIMDKLGLEIFWKQFANSPAALSYLEAHFSSESEEIQLSLLEGADNSEFSIRDWVEALVVLDQWLASHDLKLSMKDQIGYVCCTADSVGPVTSLSHLPALVYEMLTAYGCERAVKK